MNCQLQVVLLVYKITRRLKIPGVLVNISTYFVDDGGFPALVLLHPVS